MKHVSLRLVPIVAATLALAAQPVQAQSHAAVGGGDTAQGVLGSLANNWDSGDFECSGTTGVVPTLTVIPTTGPCVGNQIVLTFNSDPDVPQHINYQITCQPGPPAGLISVGDLCDCEIGQSCEEASHPDCPDPILFDDDNPLTGAGMQVGSDEQPGPPFPVTLTMEKTAGPNVILHWSADCVTAAENYGIHEGTIDSVRVGSYDHIVKTCTDAAPFGMEEIAPDAADSYYLVVPHNVDIEGSYGRNTLCDFPCNERPPSPPSPMRCAPTQVVGVNCD